MSGLTAERKSYLRKYISKKYKVFHLSFDREKDKDIIDFLMSHRSRIGYIRDLIKQDMAKKRS